MEGEGFCVGGRKHTGDRNEKDWKSREDWRSREVFGVVYHRDGHDDDDQHTHQMYLISWDGEALHVHNFAGVTSYNVGHRHRYLGTTEPAPSGVPHTHAYYTETSFDDGHRHVIRGCTGPAIPLPGGGHYHLFRGYTTVDGRIPHTHYYCGKTSP